MSQTKQKIATTQYDQSTLAHPHGLVYDEMMSNKCAEPGQVRKMLAFHSPDTLIRINFTRDRERVIFEQT
jgi:hypothetical protein